MDRMQRIIEQHPAELAIALAVGLIGFLLMLRLFRIRMGFPTILFACLLLILAGSSNMAYLQILSKGAFRWMALAIVAAMGVLYLPRAALPINRLTPVHWGWVAFLMLAMVTAPLGDHVGFALMNCAAVTVLFIGAFGTVWLFTSDRSSVVSLIDVMHRLGILVLILGFLFVAMPKAEMQKEGSEEQGRFTGFFNNANWNGNFSALVLPVILWKRQYPRSRFEKAVTSAAICVLAGNIILSGSRGAIIGGFAAALLAQWRLERRVVTRYVILAIPLVILLLVSEAGREYMEAHAPHVARMERAATLTTRTEMWAQAWPTIKEHWLTGIGLGNSRFILLTSQGQEREAAQIGGIGATLHSQYVVTLAEVGVIGLLLLAGFIAIVSFKGVSLWRFPRTPFTDLSFALVCSCLFAFADGVLHGWMTSAGSPYALLFWSLVALCLKSERLARAERAMLFGTRNGEVTPENTMAQPSQLEGPRRWTGVRYT